MKPFRWIHSLKSRIVITYSLILILGGLSTSTIGIHITGQALLEQGRRQMVYGLATARGTYDHRLQELRQSVELLASSGRLQAARASDQPQRVAAYLQTVRREQGWDFLSVVNPDGEVIVRTSGRARVGDNATTIAPVQQALTGDPAASTEVIPCERLYAEDPALAERAAVKLVPTPRSPPPDRQALFSGMVMVAAAPAVDEDGRIVAAVYAGQLINQPDVVAESVGRHWLVEEIDSALQSGAEGDMRDGSIATVLQGDVRITTNLVDARERRAVGTCASAAVRETVLGKGQPWIGRVFAVNDWYIAAYEPITNLAGERIGMLAVGLPEQPYTAARDEVTLSFAIIALVCFLLIVVATYFLTRSLVRPLEEMAEVSRGIAAGDLSQRVHVTTTQSELGLLSTSFNDMLDRISQMKSELEQWARTLENKVEERTEQLIKVQAQAARHQRLASVGQLAAGVAHEINNPLGGILTFASIVLEDLRPDDPHREELEEVVRQAVRCRKIVTGLLEFSRQRETQKALADVNQVVYRTLQLLETQALFHDIHVSRRLDANMPSAVMDESQMQQVFMNLILNAVDAMDGKGNLTIETRHSKEKKEILVRVTDTGCGIPPEIRESIFDPFFTTKDPGKGTGLGLAVSWRIVQAHGGRMDIESEVGKGTVFSVYLPLVTKLPMTDEADDAGSSSRESAGEPGDWDDPSRG